MTRKSPWLRWCHDQVQVIGWYAFYPSRVMWVQGFWRAPHWHRIGWRPERIGAMANLTEAGGIPNSSEEDSGRSALALASLFTLQFPGMWQFPLTQASDTLVNRPERRSTQRRHSLTILELFIEPDRDLMAAWLSEKIDTELKEALLTRIYQAAR